MSATSLKLPEDLKRRISQVAARAGQTPHAFMVAALVREAARSELRERFAAAADVAERAALASGRSIPLAVAFDFLESRVAGKTKRRPKARAWRGSK
jgi:predicted transcriptional regulator